MITKIKARQTDCPGRENDEKRLKINRNAYIAEAAFDYFISVLVGSAFLATILKNIGVPDSITGIVSTFVSLGFTAQLAAVLFIRPKGKGQKFVTAMHFINHLMFSALYVVPYFNAGRGVKTAAFILLFLGGHVISNFAVPFKLGWLMSYVPDEKRGRFTANKEMVSLFSGMVFSYLMGLMIDHFKATGNEKTGFILSGVTLFMLSIFHLVSLLLVKDGKGEVYHKEENKKTPGEVLKITVLNKRFQKIILLDILWHIGTGLSDGFLGVYCINELGFSLKFFSVLVAVMSIVRMIFSRPFGKYADKHSWGRMLMLSFVFGAASFLINAFATPANGKVVVALKYVFFGIYMAGENSGMMNIVFDFTDKENRAYGLGVKSAVGGIFGFLASVAGARVVAAVQARGNVVFSHTVYAQQILCVITFVIFVGVILYIKKVILPMEKNNSGDGENGEE